MKRTNLIWLFIVLAGYGMGQAQDRNYRVITDSVMGPFTHQLGSHGGPWLMKSTESALEIYRELGISIIRTQDWYGPSDWRTLFKDWNADPLSPDSYDFGSTDSMMQPLIDHGFEILFRLGVSWGDLNSANADPPGTIRNNRGIVIKPADSLDFIKFAEICRHIVMHYNQGWGNGYHWNIKRWEIWNEPSFQERFWLGDFKQFRQMYSLVSIALKSLDSSLMIGGPGQEGNSNADYIDSLLVYCRVQHTPIDFFSWHSYGSGFDMPAATPYHLIYKARLYQSALDRYGYPDVPQVVSEWNAEINEQNFSDRGKGAAYYAAALHYFTGLGISESYQYRADNHPLGLVNDSTRELKTAAYVLKCWKSMSEGSDRIFAEGSDTLGNTITASRSRNKDTLLVMISNYDSTTCQAMVQFDNLPIVKSGWFVVIREISDIRKMTVIDSSLHLTVNSPMPIGIPPQSVVFIMLYPVEPVSGVQEEGVPETEWRFLGIQGESETNRMVMLVEAGRAMEIKVEMFDIMGRRIYSQSGIRLVPGFQRARLDTPRLGAGVYFCRMTWNGTQQVKKWVRFR